MKLAIVFWFYKEADVCKNKLKILKKYNPNVKIFGLFGGDKKMENEYKKQLSEYFDDFYTSNLCNRKYEFKWINGDIMLLDWYEKRGIYLDWDSVAIVQWDMLILDSLKKQFYGIKKNQIFLSALKKLDIKTENIWTWTTPKQKYRKDYLAFRRYVNKEYSYIPDSFLCCLFVFEILPRVFFKKWCTVKDRYVGMLEYKIPTYADIFKLSFYKKNLNIWWTIKDGEIKDFSINANSFQIDKKHINFELSKKDGFRMFHPYNSIYN